jgi:hypothetical protein
MHAAAAGWSATGGAAGHMHVCMDGWLLQLQAPTWHERLGGHQQGGHQEQSLQWGERGRGRGRAGRIRGEAIPQACPQACEPTVKHANCWKLS